MPARLDTSASGHDELDALNAAARSPAAELDLGLDLHTSIMLPTSLLAKELFYVPKPFADIQEIMYESYCI